jgi:hypothetical protein
MIHLDSYTYGNGHFGPNRHLNKLNEEDLKQFYYLHWTPLYYSFLQKNQYSHHQFIEPSLSRKHDKVENHPQPQVQARWSYYGTVLHFLSCPIQNCAAKVWPTHNAVEYPRCHLISSPYSLPPKQQSPDFNPPLSPDTLLSRHTDPKNTKPNSKTPQHEPQTGNLFSQTNHPHPIQF